MNQDFSVCVLRNHVFLIFGRSHLWFRYFGFLEKGLYVYKVWLYWKRIVSLNFSVCVFRNLVFQILGRSYLRFRYLKFLGRGLELQDRALLAFFCGQHNLWKLIRNRIVDHLEKCGILSYFQNGFFITVDLLRLRLRLLEL